MLSNQLQNGMETAKLLWSRLPNNEDGEVEDDVVGISKKIDGSSVQSLDYEVIENYAYREEQVGIYLASKFRNLFFFFLPIIIINFNVFLDIS